MRPRPRKLRPAAKPSSANGGYATAPSPTVWRKPAIACLALRACRRANGEAREQRTRSNVYTKSSSGGSKRRPCCHRQIRRRCCSGRCSPPVRSTCARSMAGTPWQQSPSINQLTSLPDPVLSNAGDRVTEFQHNWRRHPSSTHAFCGNYATAGELSYELVALAGEKGASFWEAQAMSHLGCLLAPTGEAADAVHMITCALSTYHSTGATVHALVLVDVDE